MVMQQHFNPREARTLVVLAVPVFLAQLAQTSMGFVDTVVAGRVSHTDMAAVAVASSFWIPGTLFGLGLLMAITPLVAQSIGAGQKEGLGRFLRQGAWLAMALSALQMLFFYGVSRYITEMKGIDPALSHITARYLHAVVWGVPGFMLYGAQRAYLEGHGRTRPAMVAGIIGLCVNAPLNWIFAFGEFGMPRLGGVGCGVATAVVCWLMCFILSFSVRRLNPRAIRLEAPAPQIMKRIGRIGLPGAFAMLVETSSFAIIALLIAPLGTIAVAGHQIALNVSGLVFMLPLSLGTATTIRVGLRLGQGNIEEAHTARMTSLWMAVFIACGTALLLYLFRFPIARVYNNTPEVIALAGMLMFYNALYQIPDSIQMVTLGALRGYNDTRAIFIVAFLSYWGVSLPVGYMLCFHGLPGMAAMGVKGFWIGFIVGLCCSAALYLFRLARLEHLTPEELKAKLAK